MGDKKEASQITPGCNSLLVFEDKLFDDEVEPRKNVH